MAVALASVSKHFGHGADEVLALNRVTLSIQPGEFVCLVGASGSGKSTLLNLLAGLDRPSEGSLDTGGAHTTLMFQEPALFPWLTAAGNVELPLTLRGMPKAERRREVARLLELVRLTEFGGRHPHELSGGMRQRVALARALAQAAEVLLMDEPFGALDAITRDLLHDELERIWRERGLSVLFVTHNAREAVRLGDRVLVFSSRPGRVAAEFPVDLPRPRRIESPELAVLAADGGRSDFYLALGITLQRAAGDYAAALAIGSLLGVAVAASRLLRRAVGSMITGLQSMPTIAWFPLAILLFGLSERAILFVVVLGAAPSVANGLISGIDQVPPLLLRAARVIGARGPSLYRHVVLPAALPAFVGGLKQGWAFAWRSLMAGELLVNVVGHPSLGVRLQFARELADAEGLLAAMIVLLLIGMVVDGVFGVVERRIRAQWGLAG